MAKARGLPDSFKLNVSSAVMGKPVVLGDYLDEDPPAREPIAKPPPTPVAAPAAKPVQTPAPVMLPEQTPPPPKREVVQEEAPRQAAPPEKPPERISSPRAPVPATPARLRTSVPRKQINMNADTLNMVDQLMDYVQTYSVEKNLKASELFNALVLCLYEAREHIDLSRVQPRGRWGTPTAAALPIALKNAFQKAITKYNEVGGS